ncbi:MAG: AAA family ATPase [Bacteroidales bacterium]|nr:AAA family ATPase [Bacteroidales bacterium]
MQNVINSFKQLRAKSPCYIDKTSFIAGIEENSAYSFYIRPHGFGRSSLIAMLIAYYDVKQKDDFQDNFKDLYIASHPTPQRGSYLVTHVDFGRVSGNLATLKNEVHSLYDEEFERFCTYYADVLPEGTYESMRAECGHDSIKCLRFMASLCKSLNKPIFLFIDNYDYIVEHILKQGGLIDLTDTQQIDGLRSYFRFYEAMKDAASRSINRIFAIGTVPVNIRKIVEGFDSGRFYINEASLANVVGFTAKDLRQYLEAYPQRSRFTLPIDDLMKLIEQKVGGYCFSPQSVGASSLYSPLKVVALLEEYCREGRIVSNSFADEVCTLLKIRDKEYDAKTYSLKAPFSRENIVVSLESDIPIERLTDSRYFISLLYYCGLLTISGRKWDTVMMRIANDDAMSQIREFLEMK